MKLLKRIISLLFILLLILAAIFALGRYGWKLLGFRACEGAGIESVEVGESTVKIKGFYPGSFPEGFCGYYAEEQDGTLYVGFNFSAVFGFFVSGDFDVTDENTFLGISAGSVLVPICVMAGVAALCAGLSVRFFRWE